MSILDSPLAFRFNSFAIDVLPVSIITTQNLIIITNNRKKIDNEAKGPRLECKSPSPSLSQNSQQIVKFPMILKSLHSIPIIIVLINFC